MNYEDEFRLYISAYYGVELMDEYPLKVYVLKDLEKLIRDFIKNKTFSFDLRTEASNISYKNDEDKISDALFVLRSINYKTDFLIMLNHKLKEIKRGGM